MAKTAKISRLTLGPKALQKALEQSARQAQKLADAFGVKVPFAVGRVPRKAVASGFPLEKVDALLTCGPQLSTAECKSMARDVASQRRSARG